MTHIYILSLADEVKSKLHRWMAKQNDPGAAMDTLEVYAANRKQRAKKK
jgi:hypothetical protein